MRIPVLSSALAALAILAGCALPAAKAPAPDEVLLGRDRGYPLGTRTSWFFDETVRVGSFSGLDRILPHHTLRKSARPLPLKVAAREPAFAYTFNGQRHSVDDYLAHQRVTGLLIIKDGEILVERYQYDRTAEMRLLSNSMAKTVVSMAIGLAVAEGSIQSLDDTVARYVPALAGNAYGETQLRNLLRMSSGVRFREVYDGKDDSARYGAVVSRSGSIPAIKLFNDRERPQGERFQYASIETQALGLALRAATGKSLAEYVEAKIWQPMGAAADATWVIAPDGIERAGGYFSATLQDWGRLGILLANDGRRDDRAILPRDYLLAATDWHQQPAAFAPGKATPYYGYGYQTWLFPGAERRFALLGVFGQAIFVDPGKKLVMVHMAVAKNPRVGQESMAREMGALWQGVLDHYRAG